MLCNGCQSITLETLTSPGGHLIHEDWPALSSCPTCEICKCIHQRLSAELCKAYLTQLDHDSDLAHTAEYAQERKRRLKRSASIRLAPDWYTELTRRYTYGYLILVLSIFRLIAVVVDQ